MNLVPDFVADLLSFLPQWVQAIVYYGVVAVILFISVILMMAFLTLAERRVIGSIQARIGPNRVGPFGLLQPFADVLKLMLKEIVIPSSSNKILFIVAPLLACQALLFYLLYRGVRRMHGRRAASWLFPFNFACFIGLGALGAVVAKYEALAYFSDAMSFGIVRNLGGGSLGQALLFTLSEAGLILIGLGAGLLFYVAAWLFLRRRWRHAPALPDRPKLSSRQLALAVAATSLVLFAANRLGEGSTGLYL